MQIDDRLATVLRTRAAGEAAARTQFRQLLDLLGSGPHEGEYADAARERLAELGAAITAEEQSRILREPGLRLRNPALVELLASGDAKPAAAAMATARLTGEEWRALIPRLPIQARGFLRHRRDLPAEATDVLRRLGVGDLVLEPARTQVPEVDPAPPALPEKESEEGIGVLLRRIEAFREVRRNRPDAAPAPAAIAAPKEAPAVVDIDIGPDMRISDADSEFAPMLVGMLLSTDEGALGRMARDDLLALRRHQPLRSAPLRLDRPEPLGGEWRLEAVPQFAQSDGRYTGHVCTIRRPVKAPSGQSQPDDASERIRQLLHELRTPVNAIQGFAEIIQQQLFAPVPNEYRALAAGIAVDAARLLAGFDEVDRLAKLEAGAMALDEGEADMRETVAKTIRRLEGATRPRDAGFDFSASGSPFTVAIDPAEALLLSWRVMATIAGAMAPGEKLAADLSGDGRTVTLALQLPRALAELEDLFAAGAPRRDAAMRVGTFGTGFALRLARAEARAAGGDLASGDTTLTLALPCSTMQEVASAK